MDSQHEDDGYEQPMPYRQVPEIQASRGHGRVNSTQSEQYDDVLNDVSTQGASEMARHSTGHLDVKYEYPATYRQVPEMNPSVDNESAQYDYITDEPVDEPVDTLSKLRRYRVIIAVVISAVIIVSIVSVVVSLEMQKQTGLTELAPTGPASLVFIGGFYNRSKVDKVQIYTVD